MLIILSGVDKNNVDTNVTITGEILMQVGMYWLIQALINPPNPMDMSDIERTLTLMLTVTLNINPTLSLTLTPTPTLTLTPNMFDNADPINDFVQTGKNSRTVSRFIEQFQILVSRQKFCSQ